VSLVPTYPLTKALLGAYKGVSPQLAAAMAAAVGIDPQATVRAS
jgi:hypothetical protein